MAVNTPGGAATAGGTGAEDDEYAPTAEEIQTIKEKIASEPWTKIVDIG